MLVLNFMAFLGLLLGFPSLPDQPTKVLDTPPTAVCISSINVSLSPAGDIMLLPEWIDAGSTDDTGIASLTLSEDYFTCADIGPNPVILTVEDLDGNTNFCWSTVNIEDKLSPTMICSASIVVSVGAGGTATLTPSMLDAGSFDNCNVNLSIPPTTVSCSDVGGNFNLLLTGTDDSGNTNSCFTNVSVEDQTPPTARCKDSVRSLSKSGRYKPNVNHVDDGSFDNCGIAVMAVDPPIFYCSDVGTVDVTLFVQDDSGNFSTCIGTITLVDDRLPKIRCPLDITVAADPVSCDALVNYTVLYADNCPGTILIQGAGLPSGANFPIGTTTNDYKAIDMSGNLKECSFDVTVTDPGGCVPQAPESVANLHLNDAPAVVAHLAIAPNPVSSEATIQYQVLQTSNVQLEVYDLNGRQLQQWSYPQQHTGSYQQEWTRDRAVWPAGLYLLALRIDGEVVQQKTLVLE